MSYRTIINGVQVFGNNEYYPEWIEYIKSQGIKVNEEGLYQGQLTNFMEALSVIETITLRLEKDFTEKNNKSLFDLTDIPENLSRESDDSLLDYLLEAVENKYMFLPYSFYNACGNILTKDNMFSSENHLNCFKLIDGCVIEVCAR